MAREPGAPAGKVDQDLARVLTPRELRYPTPVFGTAIDFTRTRIHNTPAYFSSRKERLSRRMARSISTNPITFTDFGASVGQMAWLIHEVTHVRQNQQGMCVRSRALLNRTYDYGDLSGSERVLTQFGVEQQASMVADYFRIYHGMRPTRGSGAVAHYMAAIPFIQGRTP